MTGNQLKEKSPQDQETRKSLGKSLCRGVLVESVDKNSVEKKLVKEVVSDV